MARLTNAINNRLHQLMVKQKEPGEIARFERTEIRSVGLSHVILHHDRHVIPLHTLNRTEIELCVEAMK
jgi:hypothetical protein